MKIIKPLVGVTVAATLFIGCSKTPPGHEEAEEHHDEQVDRVTLSPESYATAGVAVEPAIRAALVETVQVTGALSYDERKMAISTARVGGRIMEIVADYGDRVRPGETLAWIDSPELGAAQAEYRRSASMNRLRQVEYERAELLLSGAAISRGELLRREADWRGAEAELQAAEQRLHRLGLSQDEVDRLSQTESELGQVYPVRSAIAGQITERTAISGRVVSSDEELFTVADLGTLWLFLQVFEKDLPAVQKGARVSLSCESHPEDRFSGTIDFVGRVLDPHSRTVKARAVIENPEGDLMPGMFVYASIEQPSDPESDDPEASTDPITVPTESVVRIEDRHVVFVETDDRTFEVRTVVVGRDAGRRIEIRSGLDEGEVIAVLGTFVLKSEVLKAGLSEHHH